MSVNISSVALKRDSFGNCVVSIKVNDKWIPVIEDNGDIINHTVESTGIDDSIKRAWVCPECRVKPCACTFTHY